MSLRIWIVLLDIDELDSLVALLVLDSLDELDWLVALMLDRLEVWLDSLVLVCEMLLSLVDDRLLTLVALIEEGLNSEESRLVQLRVLSAVTAVESDELLSEV